MRNIAERAIKSFPQWGENCEKAAIFLRDKGFFKIKESWQLAAWCEKQYTGEWPRVQGACSTGKEAWSVPYIDEDQLKTWAPAPAQLLRLAETVERYFFEV